MACIPRRFPFSVTKLPQQRTKQGRTFLDMPDPILEDWDPFWGPPVRRGECKPPSWKAEGQVQPPQQQSHATGPVSAPRPTVREGWTPSTQEVTPTPAANSSTEVVRGYRNDPVELL